MRSAPVRIFAYTVTGTATDDQTWEASGTIEAGPGGFPEAVGTALSETLMKLTRGGAVFGRPGIGCSGPYRVRKLVIEEKTN